MTYVDSVSVIMATFPPTLLRVLVGRDYIVYGTTEKSTN